MHLNTGKVTRNETCQNNNFELVSINDNQDMSEFPLLKPPPPYSVVLTPATPATPKTPTSHIGY